MAEFPNGPLQGAPLDKPKAAQIGECCPPAGVESKSYSVPTGTGSTLLTIDVAAIFKDGTPTVADVQLRETNATAVGELPDLTSFGIGETPPDQIDQIILDLDTTSASSSFGFAIAITNECGCCELVSATTFVPA